MRMTSSDVAAFFDGKSFKDWQKNMESEQRLQVAIVHRLNEVIRAVGVLAKNRVF